MDSTEPVLTDTEPLSALKLSVVVTAMREVPDSATLPPSVEDVWPEEIATEPLLVPAPARMSTEPPCIPSL